MHSKQPPVNLNLLSIRFPVTAFVSILHRITGFVLFISLPFCLYLLEHTLTKAVPGQDLTDLFSYLGTKVVLFMVLLSLGHHLFAGIRYLLLDIDIGVLRQSARRSAWMIVFLDGALLVLCAGWLL